ncbi:hydantoinase/oxoprolinase family protein, partial [Rhizobiaceae sp. 2RAB30]
RLDYDRALAAVKSLAAAMGFKGPGAAESAAEAAIRVSIAMMATEIHKGLAQRGGDSATDFALMTFGGAGGMHANMLAVEAGMDTFIVPATPATFCALGAILTNVKRDFIRSRHLHLARPGDIETLAGLIDGLKQDGARWLASEGDMLGTPRFQVSLDMRYAGQAFDLAIEVPDTSSLSSEELAELLHCAHEQVYGFRDTRSGIEITTQRVRAIGQIAAIELPRPDAAIQSDARASSRQIWFSGARRAVEVVRRAGMLPGEERSGPLIVEQDDTTIWIESGWTMRVDPVGNLVVRSIGAPA